MAPDIVWITMWHYKVKGRGPGAVAEGLFKPLMAERSSFSLVPTEFISEGETVVSLGAFKGVHGATGKTSEALCARLDGERRKNCSLPSVRRHIGGRRGATPMIASRSLPARAGTSDERPLLASPAASTMWRWSGRQRSNRSFPAPGAGFRAQGSGNWRFDTDGLMAVGVAGINEHPIVVANRQFRGPLCRRPDDYPDLSGPGL